MKAETATQPDVSEKLIGHWEQICRKLEALAEEFPAQKFDSSPVAGTRTVAEVLRHVAFWNNYVADLARGKKADDSANELPRDKFRTKAEIVNALKLSASGATSALRANSSGLSVELADTVVSFIEHNSEHYGQLVSYARLNGIVPPASR